MRRVLLGVLIACDRREAPADTATPPPTPLVADSTAVSADTGPSTQPMRAEDWEIAAGQWKFEDGEASCECSSGSVIYWKRDRPKDFDASIDVGFVTTESSAGLVFREQAGTFYQFEWYTRGTHHDRRLSLMVKNPYWVQIVTPVEREPPIGKWIRFRVLAQGDRLQAFIDGERVFDKVDGSYARSGRIGIHVFQPRTIRLREFRLTLLGE